ncbi:MAG: hypothetical protein ABJQ69_03410 [Ekhidna sp.]
MTELEEEQRKNRFYFFILFWIISVAIALYSGYKVGLDEGEFNGRTNTFTAIAQLSLSLN